MSDQARTNTTQHGSRTYPPGYGLVEPVANYRPWDIDPGFQGVYELVREHTMVDIFRLWTLWFVARQIAGADSGRVGEGDVLEIGSWRGGSGTVIARALEGNPSGGAAAGSPRRSVFLADTFAGVVKASARDTYYKGGEHANTSVEVVRELLGRAGVPEVELLVGVFPEDHGPRIADRRFALCHIDVDVYQSARECVEWVWPRMVPGGVVVFDDYGFYGCEGVTAYVNELAAGAEANLDRRPIVVPSLSGQAIVTRTVY